MIRRRKTKAIKIGNVKIGAGAPVTIQSMAKTDTEDVKQTVAQIRSLEKLGCEIIRVAVKSVKGAQAIKRIKQKITIPLVADIHFDYRLALESINQGADAIRLNPGNIKNPGQIKQIIAQAKSKKIPMRIGVNSGSLPHKATGKSLAQDMVKAAAGLLRLFEKNGFYDIIISLKASDVYATIEAYREMAKICGYPFHLGVTATGSDESGTIKSAIGIGSLLAEGIGDTIRVSLTDTPEKEVEVSKWILQSLGLRNFYPDIISCPTCGRCQVDLLGIVNDLSKKVKLKKSVKVAVMGCEVNGPGEAKDADIGIAFGKNSGTIFKNGKVYKKVKAKDAVNALLSQL